MPELSKLNWYINRLSLMSPAEILYRINNKIYSKYEKLNSKSFVAKSKSYKALNNFYFTHSDFEIIEEYYQNNPLEMEKLINKANKIIDNRITLFNLEDCDLGEKINWHKDYKSGKTCPVLQYGDIDYRDFEKIGNVKYIWEPSRFQFLFPLAAAFCLTKDEKYADYSLKQIDDWINENPYLTGINWTSSLELALRIISWGWILYSLNLCDYEIPENIKEKIGKSIYQQANYIYNHLSAFSSANNHLIGEAAGLVFAGTLFDFGKESIKWKNKGMQILFREIEKQTFSDGFNKEQAVDYHCFSLEFFIVSFLLLEKNGEKIPEKCWNIIEKSAEILMKISDSQLNHPHLGDADDGYVINLDKDVFMNSLLNISAILFNRGDFKKLAKNLDVKTVWLLGEKSVREYDSLKSENLPEESLYLKDSGYFVFKTPKTNALMDIGNLGFLSIAAHGHADALSLYLNHKNRDFLVDVGTYNYFVPKEWRNYFRSTKAHNTIEVDGIDQSEICGSFMWLKKADVNVDKTIINKDFDYVRAFHNGYIKQKIEVKHQREVLFKKDLFILVIDKLINIDNNEHSYSLHWHTGKDCSSMFQPDNQSYKIINNDESINLSLFSNCKFSHSIIKGSKRPILGFVSKSFDELCPSETIEVNFNSNKNGIFASLISFKGALKVEYADDILKIYHDDCVCSYQLGQNLF